ncbi:methionine aminotransferase [Methyloversatilis sp. XJ19-13]|uniref:methionine aminotransferase n=1 Tax=Methyloversatilis sp. XJ19-13 TaxID=2963430 RepID=UPI00211D11E2|nr:methionine aminotransferase [Methyloversatilis sp. XJ19-13]MCQ9375243.1 methionine aminotransferase [Methyloversatilis sp. XJ19-13]
MQDFPGHLTSKLPDVGTTIFTVISREAQVCGAINLAQGFPDFSADPPLFDAVASHMRAGRNQYSPMTGQAALREAVAQKMRAVYGADYDAEEEITITAGATQAVYTAIMAFAGPGDEVIVFEPAFDSYLPGIRLAGATPVFVRLESPHFLPDWDVVAHCITPRTRLIITNTPHNPTGAAWTMDDQRALARLCDGRNIVVISDEVYEHIVFDDREHASAARLPELAARTVLVSSFGKTFHVTGWKVGFVCAPPLLSAEFRRVHQFNVFAVNTPCQLGLADYMAEPARYLELGRFYQAKRDAFRAGLAGSRFELPGCAGTYFQLASYRAISDEPDQSFVRRLMREAGVAAIPVSAFHHDGHDARLIRFCFAKTEAVIAQAVKRLRAY